jgi:gamma-glutamyltranspeptidase/glutathione hydrolase
VIGSPGSQRITSSIFQVLLRLRQCAPLDAVEAPRIHCDHAGRVSLEADRISDSIVSALENAGFEIDRRDPYSFYMGCISLVLREGDEFTGVADPRRDGAAIGPQA